MIKHELARYDVYRDSGIEWLGEVPAQWKFMRLKDLAEIKGGKDFKDVYVEEGGFPVYGSGGIFGRSSECLYTKTSVLLGRKGTIDKPLFVEEPFWTVDTMYYTRIHKRTYSRFFYYLSLTIRFGFYQCGSAVPSMTQNDLRHIIFCCPVWKIQKSIANYLDTKTAQIDLKIDLLIQKVTKYGKLKQSIINETVTRGLDKTVTMKDSGVEWIGEVPEHWNSQLIKRSLRVLTDYTANGSFASLADNVTYQESGYARLVRLTDLRHDLKNDGLYVDKRAYDFLSKTKISGGEILIANVGAYTGLVKLVPQINFKATLGPNMFLAIFNDKLMQRFINYQLSSICCFQQFRVQMTTTAQPKLNKDNFRSISIVIPPLSEQKAIADYLDIKTNHIDRIIETINTQIDKLKELRKTLINDVVTGKIKVYQEGV